MTLDEHIEQKKQAVEMYVPSNSYKEELALLEELKELRGKHQALSEVYDELDVAHGKLFIEYSVVMRAFALACENIMRKELSSLCEFKCDKCKYYPNDCVSHTKANMEYYLKKAREEE